MNYYHQVTYLATFISITDIICAKYVEACSHQQYQCEENVHHRCTHPTEFTDAEIETAKQYIQSRFMKDADYKPVLPPCQRMYVRKDFKCMDHGERMRLMKALAILYRDNYIAHIVDKHVRFNPHIHKSAQVAMWHRYACLDLEMKIQAIDPSLALPYWATSTDFAHPEKSIVWQYFGHSGDESDDYCVRDGLYAGLNITPCVRRQWNANGTIPPFNSPEVDTAWMQMGTDYNVLRALAGGQHYVTHSAIGGFAGHMSMDSAPYDAVFYLFHNYYDDVVTLKWQLANGANLTPRVYNGLRYIDPTSGQTSKADILRDRLIYFNVSVLETFQVGFGRMCFIPDQLIRPLNMLAKNRHAKRAPMAIERIPAPVSKEFFPKFYAGPFTALDHAFVDVGKCNLECRPIPTFRPYWSHACGRRQMNKYEKDLDVDITPAIHRSQAKYLTLVEELNNSTYCSPYVT